MLRCPGGGGGGTAGAPASSAASPPPGEASLVSYLTSMCVCGEGGVRNLRGFLFYYPASEREVSKYSQSPGCRVGVCVCASV